MRQGPDSLVLCYHAISSSWSSDLAVSPQRFAEQIEYLATRGYRGVKFSDAALGRVEGKSVAVTFDDGFKSVMDAAHPILERFGMPGTAFIPTDLIDSREAKPDDRPPLVSWDDVRSLAAAGWEIGSHTKSHPHLTQVSDSQLEEELFASRSTCERETENECSSLAFPYGDHDDRVIAATRRAGYSAAALARTGMLNGSPLRCPRVVILGPDDPRLFRFKVSRSVRRWPTLTAAAQQLRVRRALHFVRDAA